jgi:hypothetical protein
MEDTEFTNSSDKLDTIIKSINELKVTQNKIITAINQFREDKKANDLRFNDLNGKLDNISKQFNEFLIKNKSMETKMEQLEKNLSKLELNYNSSASLNQENIFAEINDRQSRSCNVILFNLPETESNADDKLCISNIFRQIDVTVVPINVLRLGKSSNKNRPTRVTLPCQYDVFEILKNKRKLKNINDFKNITISTDRTLIQRNHFKSVIDELNARKNAGKNGLFIKYINNLPVVSKN